MALSKELADHGDGKQTTGWTTQWLFPEDQADVTMQELARAFPTIVPIDENKRIHSMKSYMCDIDENPHQSTMDTVCDLVSITKRRFWVSHPNELDTTSTSAEMHNRQFDFRLTHVALGAMCEPFSFNGHAQWRAERGRNLTINFDFHREVMKVNLPRSSRFDLAFNKVKVVLAQPTPSKDQFALYVHFDHVPNIWNRDVDGMWRRSNVLPDTTPEIIGRCSVLKVRISGDPQIVWIVMDKLQACGFQIWWTRIEDRIYSSNTDCTRVISQLNNAKSAWVMKCLLSQGFRILDQVRSDDVGKIHEVALYNVLHGPINASLFVNFQDLLRNALAAATTIPEGPKLSTYVLVPKVIVTPTRVISLPPEHVKSNRVLREFHHQNFLSVSFRDEDESRLVTMSPESISQLTDRIKQFLHTGVHSDGRHYEFLGCSNSQMRNHGVWMYAKDPETPAVTIDSIRRWMGDVSEIRCTAVYVSRLGQFFSSSEHVLDLNGDQYTVVFDYPDVTRNGFCFTDGVGCISPDTARKVAKKLNLKNTPSAFQIRLAGCKGVLSVNPKLGPGRVHIRPSMRKFESRHLQLEVIDYSRPHQLCLNRQVITILSALGVKHDTFLELLDDEFHALANMFTDNEVAVGELRKIGFEIDLNGMIISGIDLVHDCFWKSLLLVRYRETLRLLREKTSIMLPANTGRLLMGIADETNTLKSGEVFVQYSTNLHDSGGGPTIHMGEVVVSKSPSFHPGDVRKFKAVHSPELEHIVDCLVFPVAGPRPHSDEMSGSDLDGDMYWVCWYPALIPPADNKEPMDFPKQPHQTLDHEPRQDDIIDYYGDYIKHDLLGPVGNAHLAQADRQEEGIFSNQCLQLARILSEAVDFTKSGRFPDVDSNLRPILYPDFMMKREQNQYRSEKVLGTLYRKCTQLCESQSEHEDKVKHISCSTQWNSQLDDIFKSHIISEVDLDEARKQYRIYSREMLRVFNLYGIEDEATLIAGRMHSVRGKKIIRGEAYEIGNIIKAEVNHIRRTTKASFKASGESDMVRKSKAWYQVAYGDGRFKSFAWIGIDCTVKAIEKYPRHIQNTSPAGQIKDIDSKPACLSDRKRAINLLKRVIENNVDGVDGHLNIVEFPDSTLTHEREYLIINSEYTSKEDILATVLKLQENTPITDLTVSAFYILHTGALITLLYRNSEVIVEIINDERRRVLIDKIISVSSNMQSCGWFWILANWIRLNSRNAALQNITLLHIWEMALPFLGETLDGNGLHSFLEYYSKLESISNLHREKFDLWDLSVTTLKQVVFLIITCRHLVAMAGNESVLAQERVCEAGGTRQRSTHILSTDAINMLNNDPEMVKTTLCSRSGCSSVDIKQVSNKNTTLNILEGFGSKFALKRLEEQVQHFEKMAGELTDPTAYSFTRKSQIIILEGIGNDSELVFNNTIYRSMHVKKKYMALPKLASKLIGVPADPRTQLQSWEDNLLFLADIYDEQLLGELRIIVRFAIFKCTSHTGEIFRCSVGGLLDSISQSKSWNIGHDGAKRHKNAIKNALMVPVNANITRLHAFLRDEGLVHCAQKMVTVCTVFTKGEIGRDGDARTSPQVEVVYDGDLKVEHIRFKSIRWSALSFVRQANLLDGMDPKGDISIQLQSRRVLKDRSSQMYKDFADPNNPILAISPYPSKESMPYLKISKPFMNKVKFIRQKIIDTYKYPTSIFRARKDHFTAQVRVEISSIREYRIDVRTTDRDAYLNQLKNVTVHLIKLPPLSCQEEQKVIMDQLLDLSLKISDIVV